MTQNVIRLLVSALVALVASVHAPAAQSQTPSEFSQWLYWYTSGDLRADFNGDQLLSPGDFNAFLLYHSTPTLGGGWTELQPSGDSRQIYVSPSGSDSNSGLSPTQPVRTLDRAYSLIRNGYPDWILLERGRTFYDTFPTWRKSGRSASEPMVVSSYGQSTLRPSVYTGNASGLVSPDNEVRRHLRFVGFRLYPHQRSGSGSPVGVSFVGPVEDVLIEDCYIFGFTTGVVFQGDDNGRSRDVRIRRSIVANNWARGQHAQGLFFKAVDGVTIEECVIDTNGWFPGLEAESRTIFNHNVYVQRDVTGLTFVDNFVARGSSHGVQARNGGVVDRNVFWQNPISVLWGNEGYSNEFPVSGSVSQNVILEGVDMAGEGRGWGILLENIQQGEINENILSRSLAIPQSSWGIGIKGPNSAPVYNTLIEENVFYNWYNAFSVQSPIAESVIVRRNTFSSTSSSEHLIDHRVGETLNNVAYVDNKYFQNDSNQTWFAVNFQDVNVSDWRRDRDPQGDVLSTPFSPFPNAGWTLEGYALSRGFGSVDSFVSELRAQRRGQFRESLTTRSILNSAREAYGLPAIP